MKSVTDTTLFDFRADPAPIRHFAGYEVHPDAHRLPDQVFLRNRTDVAAILAAIPIVAHDKILPIGNHVDAVLLGMTRIMDQRPVHASIEIFNINRRLLKNFPIGTEVHRFAINRQSLAFVRDFITWQANYSLDVVDAGIRRQAKHDDVASLGLASFDYLRFGDR